MVFTVQEILNVSCMMTRFKVIQFMLPRSETGRVEKMSRVEEKESRGFYEQQLVDLEPCSLFRYTVSLPFHETFFLCKVGDRGGTFSCEPRCWHCGRASKD